MNQKNNNGNEKMNDQMNNSESDSEHNSSLDLNKGHLFIIVAPSGTGKSTLIKELRVLIPELSWSVSHTTRKPRPGEVSGVDYFFISKEEFFDGISDELFVEWAEVHGNFYGTSQSFVKQGIKEGKMLLFDLDVQGSIALLNLYRKNASAIFIAPPSIQVLEERLRKRATEQEEIIQLRIKNAMGELAQKNVFDYVVVNDDFNRALAEICNIVRNIMTRVKNG